MRIVAIPASPDQCKFHVVQIVRTHFRTTVHPNATRERSNGNMPLCKKIYLAGLGVETVRGHCAMLFVPKSSMILARSVVHRAKVDVRRELTSSERSGIHSLSTSFDH